jgi:dipeptide transport system ATP-binding protein
MAAPLLEIRNLSVEFRTGLGPLKAVDGVDLTVEPGEVVGVVGESGSGKSVAMLAVMGLLPWTAKITADRLAFQGQDLLRIGPRQRRRLAGKDMAIIFQEPMSSLNPCFTVEFQLTESLRVHEGLRPSAARRRALDLLALVGIPSPEDRLSAFPHQLSGGMSQRVMIAMAIACNPKLLIADEPTTALDVTIQAQILRLLKQLNEARGLAVILITHDLGVVADIADRVLVMYAGRVVETGTLDQIFYDPQHPYTWGLLGSIMRLDRPRSERLAQIKGQPPSLLAPPEGCHFRPRCPHAFNRCTEVPGLEQRGGTAGHRDRCWLSGEQKKTLRVVESGDIGLEVPAA